MGCVETMDKKRLFKLISSFSMADGGIYKRRQNDNGYFAMNMLSENEDYIDYVKTVIEQLCEVKKTNVSNPCKNPQINIRSMCHPALTSIHSRIYQDKYKGLDWHFVKDIDFEMLSIFYMCDGSLYIEKPNAKKGLRNESVRVALNMKRLSYGDAFLLKKFIKENLNLEFNINKQLNKNKTGYYYYLVLRTKDVKSFMEGISPYMLESFRRKIYPNDLPLGSCIQG